MKITSIHKTMLTLLCALMSSLFIIGRTFEPSIGTYDEGFTLTNATRMLSGEVPHREFWSVYPLGASLVLAAAFKIWNVSLIVARTVHVVFSLTILLSVFTIFHRYKSSAISCLAVLLITSWFTVAIITMPFYSLTFSLAASLVSVTLATYSTNSKNWKMPVVAACLSSIIVIFRHDFAFYQFIAYLMILVVEKFCLNQKQSVVGLTNYAVFVLSLAVSSILIVCAMISFVGIDNFIDQLITFPSTIQREYRRLPVPNVDALIHGSKTRWLTAWLPIIVVPIGLVYWSIVRAPGNRNDRLVLLFSGLMSLITMLQSHNRFDLPHAMPSFVYCTIFTITLTCVFVNTGQKRRLAIPAALLLLLSLVSLLVFVRNARVKAAIACINPSNTGCMNPRTEQSLVVKYIRQHTRDKQFVFVGNSRHDICFANDASLYFLMMRPCPTKWNDMHPGVITEASVQEVVISDLIQNKVEFVVLADLFMPSEPNDSSKSSGHILLDRHISSNFHAVFTVGKYTILEKNP
jgi:hypothetical protein